MSTLVWPIRYCSESILMWSKMNCVAFWASIGSLIRLAQRILYLAGGTGVLRLKWKQKPHNLLESEKAGQLFRSLSRFTNRKYICTGTSQNSCKRTSMYPMSCFGFVWNYNWHNTYITWTSYCSMFIYSIPLHRTQQNTRKKHITTLGQFKINKTYPVLASKMLSC
jgi:hypothetical protein